MVNPTLITFPSSADTRRHEVNRERAALAVGGVRLRVVQGLAMVEHDAAGGQIDHDRWNSSTWPLVSRSASVSAAV